MSAHKKAAAVAAQRAIIGSQSSQVSTDAKRVNVEQSSGADEDLAKMSSSAVDIAKFSQTSTQPNSDVSHTSSTAVQPPIIPTPASTSNETTPPPPRQPWDYVDEICNLVKTGHPLLVLTIENMVDQFIQKFKASAEEEIYRLVCMLLIEAAQVILCSNTSLMQLLMVSSSTRIMPRELHQPTMMGWFLP